VAEERVPAQLRDVDAAAAWLRGLIDVEKRPDLPYRRLSLAPIRALLARMGNPERGLAAVHVAGSKGKGSTALMCEGILRARGRRTGTFTSPHLERWTERFRLDGDEVDGTRLTAAVAAVRPHVEALRAEDPSGAPTFFDATTAAAFWLFREADVEIAVLEVGLGGRLDSTNACEPVATCLTSIELEHTERLGHTLAAIAGEKAGILKPGVPAVLGDLPEEALDVALRRAAEVGAPVVRSGIDFGAELLAHDLDGMRVRLWDGASEVILELPWLGAPSAQNAALAAACARRALGEAFAPPFAAALSEALPRVKLPARVEVMSRAPLAIVDAAHTPASARALADVLARVGRRCHLVMSVSADKDLTSILDVLVPHAARLTLTRAEPARSLEPERIAELARRVAPELELEVVPNPHLALRAALERCEARNEPLCVAGSVYLAGIARTVLRPRADPAPET
jgi:dihydrofolate synthase/folylpolyglutamate synthase